MNKMWVTTGLIVFFSSLIISSPSLSHPGRTNSSGCHNDRKSGGSHCHGGGSFSGTTSSPVPPMPQPQVSESGKQYSLSSLNYLKACNLSVKKNDSGGLVEHIQERLKRKGFTVAVDGDFGDKTENAVKLFQEKNNLAVDGVVGCSTYRKLDE